MYEEHLEDGSFVSGFVADKRVGLAWYEAGMKVLIVQEETFVVRQQGSK